MKNNHIEAIDGTNQLKKKILNVHKIAEVIVLS